MTDLTANAWEERYQEKRDRWDLGCPAPPFITLLNSEHAPPIGKMAVLGCGKGHDAMLFSNADFEIIGFDFAPSAIAQARNTAEARHLTAKFLERNIFELEPELHHQFDYVLEHTCFCAIDPTLRSQYIQVIKQLLRPQGKLIALFYTHNRPDGPPYGIAPKTILDLFRNDFEVLLFQAETHSIARRQGEEHLAIFQVKYN